MNIAKLEKDLITNYHKREESRERYYFEECEGVTFIASNYWIIATREELAVNLEKVAKRFTDNQLSARFAADNTAADNTAADDRQPVETYTGKTQAGDDVKIYFDNLGFRHMINDHFLRYFTKREEVSIHFAGSSNAPVIMRSDTGDQMLICPINYDLMRADLVDVKRVA